jgi:hypothetical protein
MHLKKPASGLKIATENEKIQNTFRYLAKKKINSVFKHKKHITQKATTHNETHL